MRALDAPNCCAKTLSSPEVLHEGFGSALQDTKGGLVPR